MRAYIDSHSTNNVKVNPPPPLFLKNSFFGGGVKINDNIK